MTHILSCRTGSLYCDTERLTMAYLEGPRAQWGACQSAPDPGGFDHNVCIIMGRGTYVGALGSCPTRRTESMVLCECVYVRRKGGRGDVCKSKCVCVKTEKSRRQHCLASQRGHVLWSIRCVYVRLWASVSVSASAWVCEMLVFV